MQIRNRVRELRYVRAGELRPHPKNWRVHPTAQRDALRGVLAEIGYAGALLARPLADGSLELIDGHLRAETTPDMEVPVLLVDLTDAEAEKLLALHDPLASLAEANTDVLAELLAGVETQNEAVQSLLDSLVAESPPAADAADEPMPPAVDVPDVYQVIVACADEAQQQDLFDRLTAEGFECRLQSLS